MNEKSVFRMQTVEIKKQQMKYNYIFSKKVLVFTCTYFCRFIHKIGQNP